MRSDFRESCLTNILQNSNRICRFSASRIEQYRSEKDPRDNSIRLPSKNEDNLITLL